MFGWGKKNINTFHQVKHVSKENRHYRLREINKANLEKGNIEQAVKLPPGENVNDWIAMNLIEFYNQIQNLYHPIGDYCTTQTCPETTAGPGFKYYWQDGVKYKKPTMLPAHEYISNVLEWIQSLLNNEKYFPSDPSIPFPQDFVSVASNMFKRLFRIYAHVYHHHRDKVVELGIESKFDTSFKNFALFCLEFKLIPKEQMEPLAQIMKTF
ncbi:Mob1/phocein family protein [Histomonas meleagridis]|uniref:Mob1/phocein family protein n=1 Tax=Histomonas meleagridis TaxID=135588 RepID=UPI003559B97B|nr:Mob1/phocein family protein [Histomonas meleagridis]KAH0797952.1 Mob1/phocein family protein [Histomonas meleagridis]